MLFMQSQNNSHSGKLSLLEKVGYGVGDMASNFYMGFFSIFLLYYYVDVWGISPAGAATMFLVTKVLDAVSDPAMGLIADRTKTKWGKYRPYLIWGAIPYACLGYLLFLGPDLSQTGKLIFAYVTYSLIMLNYTVINVPYSALLAVISPSSEERTKATQFRFIFASLGTLTIGATAKPLVEFFGGGNELLGFRLTIILFAVLSIILFAFTFYTTRERIKPKPSTSSVKKDLSDLKSNSSWIILAISSIIIVVGFITRISSTAFYTKYNMGFGEDPYLWWMDRTSLIITMGFVGQLLGALITPTLLKYIEKKKLAILINLIFALSIIATYFIPTTAYILTLCVYALGVFCFGVVITLLFAMYTDCAEYGEWKTGNNTAGLTVSASMFSLKFGSAVGSAIPGYILGWYGFVKDSEQSIKTLEGINITWNIVPALFFLTAAALLYFYKLDRSTMKNIEEELKIRRSE